METVAGPRPSQEQRGTRRRWGAAVATALTATSLLAASGAEAATEVGSECVANDSEANRTMLSLSSGGSIPSKVPATGVVTAWRTQVEPGRAPLAQRLQIFRPLGGPNRFFAVAASATETVVGGANSFATRIPVKAGDRFGLYGPAETLFCSGSTADTSGLLREEATVHFLHTFEVEPELGTPVIAIIEPDVDRDHYGDESQDECPRSAAAQVRCEPIAIDVTAVAREHSIRLQVGVSARALVRVTGQVGWGFKPNPKLHTHSTRLIVGLRGGLRTIPKGRTVQFRIGLPKTVMRRLGRLGPDESIVAKIAVSATDPAGVVNVRRLRVKLPGQGR